MKSLENHEVTSNLLSLQATMLSTHIYSSTSFLICLYYGIEIIITDARLVQHSHWTEELQA